MLRRHTCKDGVFIRTTFMKGFTWDLNDTKGFGNADGNVKVGPGVVFAELQTSAAANDRFIASGWCPTVGVIGFFLGGGHGPFASSKGLGVDQILEVEILTANGNITKANANTNSDLFWAVRGGGGSTWGILLSITLKAYKTPVGGYTYISPSPILGNACQSGITQLQNLLANLNTTVLNMDPRLAGTYTITPISLPNDTANCFGQWYFTG